MQTKYYTEFDPSPSNGDDAATLPAGGRSYITSNPNFDKTNPDYWTPNLLGGYVEYDVDLSDHDCGCIAAFYTVSMPGKDANGNPWLDTDGYGYCDANQVAGNWCPEMDIMEANKYSWATTPHTCDSPSDKGFYSHCD